MFVLNKFVYDDRTVKGGVSTSRCAHLPPSAYQTPRSPRPWTRLRVAGWLRAGGPGRPWTSWRECRAARHSLWAEQKMARKGLCVWLVLFVFFENKTGSSLLSSDSTGLGGGDLWLSSPVLWLGNGLLFFRPQLSHLYNKELSPNPPWHSNPTFPKD